MSALRLMGELVAPHQHGENDIADGSVLARLAADEVITGRWDFSGGRLRLAQGTLAQRPTSGNSEGHVYWATDTDRLYIWDSAQWRLLADPTQFALGYNLLKNGSFESWSAGASAYPDGWTSDNSSPAAQESTNKLMGSYALKVARVDTGYRSVQQAVPSNLVGYLKGKEVSLGCWAKATLASYARIAINDGVAEVESTRHNGDGTWQFLTVTRTVDANASKVEAKLITGSPTSSSTVYYDGAVLVEGPAAQLFVPHPNDEHLKAIDYQDTAGANLDYAMLRLECGNGTISAVGAGSTGSKAVTFGTAFRKLLVVQVTPVATDPANFGKATVGGKSTTGFTAYIRNDSGAPSDINFDWLAIGVV